MQVNSDSRIKIQNRLMYVLSFISANSFVLKSCHALAFEVTNDASAKFGLQTSFSRTEIGSFIEYKNVATQLGEFSYSNSFAGEFFSHRTSLNIRESSFLCIGGTEAKFLGNLSTTTQYQGERSRFRLGLSAELEKSGLDECRSGPRGLLGLGNDSDLKNPRYGAAVGNSFALTERLNNDIDIGYTFFQFSEKQGTFSVANSLVFESSSVSLETLGFKYLRQGMEIFVSEEVGPNFKHTHNLSDFLSANAEIGFAQVTKATEEDPSYLALGGVDVTHASDVARYSARYNREISSRDTASPRFYTDTIKTEASQRFAVVHDGGIAFGVRLEQGRISAEASDELRQSYDLGLKHFWSFYGFGSKTPSTGLTSEFKLELTSADSFQLFKQYLQTSIEWQF